MGTERPVAGCLRMLWEAAQAALGLRRQTDPEGLEKLMVQLRAEGHTEVADRLDDILHHTAWTTGSELNGVLGLTIRAFVRSRPTLSRSLRQALRACLRATRPPWPALR